MPPSNRLITTPDDNVAMARRFQHRAIATLMAVCEDSAAPASAKSQAAAKLLEIGFGRPSMAKQITVADLATMPDDLKMQLLEALLSHYMPNGQRALLKAACDEAVRQAQLTFPKPNRFKRGAPLPRP